MEIDTTTHKTNGRKTTNDALIMLLRAGVIASMMMLVLGAGMVAATESVADAKIHAAFAEDKIQSMSSQTETFVGQGFDKCEIPTLSQMQNWITNSPYGAVNLYIGGSCRSCPNSALTASYVSQLSQQGWKFIPTWVGPQSACWVGSCGSRISNDPATAYNQGISEANAAIDVAIDLGLALADGSGTIIYYDLENYDTTNTACRNAAKSFISGWTAQLHARGSKAGVYGSSCGSEISDFASISNVPDAIWSAHWIYSSYNSGATVWDVACLSNGLWVDHQRIRQYAGGHDETWGGVTLNIDCNVIDGIVASVGPADIIPLTGDMYGNDIDIIGFYNTNTAEFTFGGETDDTVNIEFADQGAELGVVSPSSSYDRQAAYNYAMQWWNSCNHDCSGSWDECSPYRYYGWECCGYPSHNGDCANFVSQCLIAGGHPYLTGEPDCKYPDGTLCCRGDCGKAEVGAKRLGDCLVAKGWERTCGYHASPPSNIDVGDVLIYHTGSCDGWTAHATIVTYVSGSDIRITCHSENRKNEPYTYMSTSHPYYEWLHYPSQPTIYPLTGDMYKSGTDTTGIYNTGTAEFTFGGKTVRFGQLNDKPIIGDWDGDGYDEICLFRSSTSMFYLVTRNWATLPYDVGAADKDIPFSYPEDIPIAGDWDGDGDDDIGGYYPGTFYLYQLNLGSSTATSYRDVPFGLADDIPLIGDWDNDGDDDVAVCRKYDLHDNPTHYFDLDLTGVEHEIGPCEWGDNDDIPIAGRWNAGSGDKIGVYRPSTGEFIRNYNIPPDANNPPNTPLPPSGEGSGNTGTSYSYSTSATDPDGDQVKYTFDWDDGTTSETGFVNSGTSASRSHSWSSAGTYYVKAMATDTKGASSGWSGSKVVTITNPNNPPYTPSNPSPSNHATGQSISADLSWTGGDPDAGDTVKYDVYFGTSTSPPLVSNDQSGTTHDPGTLSYSTKYYWKIIATDNHGASTSGALWDFTTGSAPNNAPTLSSGSVSPSSGDTSTTFDYYVTYTDSDGDAPTTKYVYVDGSPHTMTMISGDYTSGATFKYSTTLLAGSHNYYFYFDDGHGHAERLPSGIYSGPSVSTPDTIDPIISISYPTNGQTLTTASITVIGSASDNVGLSKVEVKVNSGSWQTASGSLTSWSKSVTLSPGSNTIYARATDTSGNTEETSVTVTYDPPGDPPSSPTLNDPGTTDTDGSYTVSWSGVNGATSYTLEEDTSSSFSSPTEVYSGYSTSKYITGRSDGTYYYRVKACNACGCSGWSNIKNIEVEIPDGSCQCDLNDDGYVNNNDVLVLVTNWGPCSGCEADLNDDGYVNNNDVLVLVTNWGPCP